MRRLILAILAIGVVLLVACAAPSSIPQAPPLTPQPTPAPIPTPEPAPVPALEQTKLEDIMLRLEDLPTGWHQISFEEWTPEYITREVEVKFRNKKHPPIEENIVVHNRIALYEEEQDAAYWLQHAKDAYQEAMDREHLQIHEIALGDDGLYYTSWEDKAIARDDRGLTPESGVLVCYQCGLLFIKGSLAIEFQYYGWPLMDMTEAEIVDFVLDLARKVEARIPATVP